MSLNLKSATGFSRGVRAIVVNPGTFVKCCLKEKQQTTSENHTHRLCTHNRPSSHVDGLFVGGDDKKWKSCTFEYSVDGVESEP